MGKLVVVCQHCGREYPSTNQMDKQSFLSTHINISEEACHHCGKVTNVSKQNMKYKD
jgi:hypothetical protein